MNRISFVLFTAGLVFASSFASAIAADRFDKVPAVKGQKASGLVIRIVQYAGSTNGAITVDVKNPSDEPQEFTAKGLYSSAGERQRSAAAAGRGRAVPGAERRAAGSGPSN